MFFKYFINLSIFIYLFMYLFTFLGDLFLDVYLQLVQLSHARAHEAIHVTHFNPTEGRSRDENHADSPEGCVCVRACVCGWAGRAQWRAAD